MHYWLLKTEPSCWSWEQQVQDGKSAWDGVRNFQAQKYLRSMELGDLCFFYHSTLEKRIMGIVEVMNTFCPDPSDPSNRFGMVYVKTVRPLTFPVTLKNIKTHVELSNLMLLRQSQLSVMPIDPASWDFILKLSEKE